MSFSRRHFVSGLAAFSVVSSLSSRQVYGDLVESNPTVIDGLDVSVLDASFINILRKGGVHCVHISVSDALHIGSVYHTIEENSKDLVLAKSVADIVQAKKVGKIAVVMGSQNASVIQNELLKTRMYRAIRKTLESYHGLGLRILMICYNVNNIFGGGSLNPTSPLTRAGRVLVEEMHKLNMIVDVGGHTGEQTSLDAIAMSEGVPVICSHTNMASLNPNVRATSDLVCEGIAKSGGVIGITALSDFHTRSIHNYQQHGARSPQATLDQHLDQYDYAKNLVGIDHVALGPDFMCGKEAAFEKMLSNLETAGNLSYPPEMLSDGRPQLVKGYKNIAEVGNVIRGLGDRGWSQMELNKLLGENWLRVYKKVWGA